MVAINRILLGAINLAAIWITVDAQSTSVPVTSSPASSNSTTSTGSSLPASSTATPVASSAVPMPTGPLCQTYPSNGYCKDYINYQVYTGGFDFKFLEPQLSNLTLLSALPSSNPCVDDFYKYACSALYPKCLEATNTSSGVVSQSVLIGCMSTCKTALSECQATFASVGQSSQLPNCNKTNPLLGNAPLMPDGQCLVLNKLSASSNTTSSSTTANNSSLSIGYLATCPSPFIRDPLASPTNSSATSNPLYCKGGCCVACPQQNTFYREHYLGYGFTATDIVRAVSAVASFFMMVSYLLLPDKRTHPSTIILMSSISIFIFSAVVFFPLFNPKKVQCYDDINTSTEANNILCAVQGVLLIFSSFATCTWVAALILNMHISIVWNSNFFAKRYIILNIICWGIPLAMALVALLTNSVQYEFGTMCLVSIDKIFDIFFYPLAVIIMPAFLIHLATFFHIARISMRQGIESELTRSMTSSNNKTSNTVMSHRRHVMNAFKIQWRALLIAVIAITTVVFYWIFYFLQVSKFQNVKTDPNFIGTWLSCMLSGDGQNTCADLVSSYLPNFAYMILAETLVSSVGLWLFIVFARQSLFHEWQDYLYELRQSRFGGSGRVEKDGEQFFAL